MTQLMWFRQDLRLHDNPALSAATRHGPVLPIYILDETEPPAGRPMGAAGRWWLHHSLAALQESLGQLLLLRGDPLELLPALADEVKASGVFWNRCYESHAVARDRKLKELLRSRGLAVMSYNSALLFEPWEVQTPLGQPHRVFTPFWRACQQRAVSEPSAPCAASAIGISCMGDTLESWNLLPSNPDWARGFQSVWSPGETGARDKLSTFLRQGLRGYREFRDHPAAANVSRLSPHIHWGEISIRQIWWEIQRLLISAPELRIDADKFLSELGWREYSYHLLYHFPTLPTANWKPAFDSFPWTNDPTHLRAWQRGLTGYPLVDAGMRELWATGYLANRARLVVASFLTKHLRIDWRLGEAWFWDTLVDADEANNAAGWQWVFGSGADAAPFFRIFNPAEQGRKFDPDGHYIRRWCPELARLPNEWIHAPFEGPDHVLLTAGLALGRDYPRPIVEHHRARQEALAVYSTTVASAKS